MNDILRQIDKVRQKIKKGVADKLLMQKPFAEGMYRFSMFMIDYYARVRENLKIDYDSFMIIQTVVSHSLYQLNKKKDKDLGLSYSELEKEWDKNLSKADINLLDAVANYKVKVNNKKVCLCILLLATRINQNFKDE